MHSMLFSLAVASFGTLAAAAAAADGGSHHLGARRHPAAFGFSTRHRRPSSSSRPPSGMRMARAPSKQRANTVAEIEAESDQLRGEIEELREEALRRLEDLNEKLTSSASSSSSVVSSVGTTTSSKKDEAEEGLLPAPAPIKFTETKKKSQPKRGKTIGNLLDETRWKVSLSIGREPGTWMPAEWGKSGQRINISFIAEFTPSQLFDRDDFLRGGYANAKILHVVDNEIKLGPSVSEGQRTYKVKDGGWQVTRGDGPMGTDLLRFYIEVDEEIAHTGGDLYIPKGRVYSSCGYFPFMGDGDAPSVKDSFISEMKNIEEKITKIEEKKNEIKNPFNLEGIKLGWEIYQLEKEAGRMANNLNFMAVKEPDKRLLRFSKDEDVGLTKEGGICCQVNKGPVVEYHILGRFSIASADHD